VAADKTADRDVEVLVVGAGVAGICAGVRLRKAGIEEFVIIDRALEFGGTWYANTYPGIACDIPSQVYSYSFAPHREWSRVFAPGAEIQRYLLGVVDEYGLRAHAALGTELLEARWDDGTARWMVTTSAGGYRARFLVVGTGVLEDPRMPDIPGLAEFPGAVFHSARWPGDADLTGRRVAVLGTGASAIQIVPEIQPLVQRLTVFQRTPAWVVPKLDLRHGRTFRALVRRRPWVARALRTVEWAGVDAFLASLYSRRASTAVSVGARWNMRRAIKDPDMRRALTPDYVLGCKRALLSNTYYRALAAPNCDLVASGVASIEGDEVVASDGTRRRVDTIVAATGFHFADPPIYRRIHARDGRTVAQRWDGRPEAYQGTAIAGCPNLFTISGPNGSTASVFASIEATCAYITSAMRIVRERRLRSVEVPEAVARRWKAAANRHLATTMHSVGGCTNQYVDRDNNNLTLYPATMRGMGAALSRFDVENYAVTHDVAPNPSAAPAPQAVPGAAVETGQA
jgi:cation diffusion facilitator CzcD-associated flavoprotein CzcO